MGDPGLSLFQDIQVNSHDDEEEDELQEKIRREELQNLLTEELEEFQYDDEESVANSSVNVSLADDNSLKYKKAFTANDQLAVLYDVEKRKNSALKEEYDKYKEEKERDLNLLKTRLLLCENENTQLQVTLKNSEDLLVEKTNTIKNLEHSLKIQDAKVHELQQQIQSLQVDEKIYKEQITELQMKLQCQNGPFNLNSKYNSEEYQKSLQNKISQLESALEEQDRNIQMLNKDKQTLKEELDVLIIEKRQLQEDNSILLTNFDQAQQQCRNLLDVIEMTKRESNHLRELLEQTQNNDQLNLDISQIESQDNVTLAKHIEKLKKMLLDKSFEVDTLKTKQKHYENDLKELLTYRQLKHDVYKKEFQQCNNSSHTRDFLIMQNDLQNYRRTIDDKDQQILNLNSINKDLQEKIEDMILQTRNEILNISQKYSLPQLTVMSQELKNAEETIRELNDKLKKSEEKRQSLLQKFAGDKELKEINKLLENEKETNIKLLTELTDCKEKISKLNEKINDLQIENKQLKSETQNYKKEPDDTNLKSEYEQLKTQLNQVLHFIQKNNSEESSSELAETIKHQMEQFLNEFVEPHIEKGILEEKINSWKKLLDNFREDKSLKSKYNEAQERLKELEDLVQDMKNAITILEGEKCSLKFELKNFTEQLEESHEMCSDLEKQIERMKNYIQENDNSEAVGSLRKELEMLKKDNQIKEESRQEMSVLIDKMTVELEQIKNENLRLETQLKEANHRIVKRNLEKELQETEHEGRNPDDWQTEHFRNNLQAELIKSEIRLRDELQIEYQKRINNIEKRYQKTTELCQQQKEQLHQQDQRYREHLKLVMSECARCTKEMEDEKFQVLRRLNLLQEEFEKYKRSAEEIQYRLSMKMEQETAKHVNSWKNWSKQVVSSCLNIEELNKKARDKILADMNTYDAEIANIEKTYNNKIMKKMTKT